MLFVKVISNFVSSEGKDLVEIIETLAFFIKHLKVGLRSYVCCHNTFCDQCGRGAGKQSAVGFQKANKTTNCVGFLCDLQSDRSTYKWECMYIFEPLCIDSQDINKTLNPN